MSPFLQSEISKINSDILTCTDAKIIETILFDDKLFSQFDSNRILDARIISIVSSKKINGIPLYSKVRESGQQAI